MDSERHQTSNPDVSQDIEATKQGNASTMSPGSSLAEFGNSVSVLAQESAQTVQTTVAEGVPQAVNTVQEKISAIVGGAKEATESVSGCESSPRGRNEETNQR